MEPLRDRDNDAELFLSARSVLAGGVSASMRLHPYLGRPMFFSRGDGPYLFGLDGERYIDFNGSNGAALLGHNHPAVRRAIVDGLDAGIIAGTETPYHQRLAATLTEVIPAAERVRFASTGTEATMVAVRLARHATGRDKILKFAGHFHGLSETFLFKAGSSEDEIVPSSGGVPPQWGSETVIVPWNDADKFDRALERHEGEIAAVICEPVHYNAGCIPPEPGFLEHLRRRTSAEGIVLIFDEVLSGFRMALGGAQEWSGVTPDLCTLAKALANGMPLSVVAGRSELMEQFAPGGPVAHSGTYSGHLLSVTAALATLNELRVPGLYDDLRETSEGFYRDLQDVFDRHGLPVRVQGLGARFGIYFGQRDPVTNYADAAGHDHRMNERFVRGCLDRGVYFHAYTTSGAPGHAGFSLAHREDDLALALTVIDDVAREIASGSD